MINSIMAVLISLSFAQGKSSLYKRPEGQKTAVSTGSFSRELSSTPIGKRKISPSAKSSAPSAQHNTSAIGGNLDREILVVNSTFRSAETGVIVPTNFKGTVFGNLKSGEVLQAEILESAIAFPDSKAPIRARVSSGPLKGAILLGEATLEKNSKRILIDFRMFRPPRGQEDYKISASALDLSGILGIEGEYNSKEPKFFGATFLASLAAAFADASVNRSQNVLGNYVEEPGTDTLTKKAAATALSKTADVFAERIKTAPEYSVLEGPVLIQVLITGNPVMDR